MDFVLLQPAKWLVESLPEKACMQDNLSQTAWPIDLTMDRTSCILAEHLENQLQIEVITYKNHTICAG